MKNYLHSMSAPSSRDDSIDIYLDLNKWVDLARAYGGQERAAQYGAIAQKLFQAIQVGNTRLPVSAWNIMEVFKSSDVQRRRSTIEVMERYSLGWSILPEADIVYGALDAAVCDALGVEGTKSVEPPIRRGWQHAFGSRAKQWANVMGRADFWILAASLADGPTKTPGADWIEPLRKFAAQVEAAKPALRNATPDDRARMYAAILVERLEKPIAESVVRAGRSVDDFLALGPDRLTQFVRSIPPLDVELELACASMQHWDRPPVGNDTADIAQLAVAIPFCDVVVTERFWCSIVRQRKLDSRYGTACVPDINDLRP